MTDPTYFTCTLGQAASKNLIDESFQNINTLIDTLAEEHGGSPAAGFAISPSKVSPDRPWGNSVYTFKDLQRASLATAALLQKRHGEQLDQCQSVALICPSTPEFLLTWLGLMRLGKAVLLIAPQCQPSAIAHLCNASEANLIYFDPMYEEQATTAAQQAENLTAKALPFKSEFDIMQLMKLGTGRYLLEEPAEIQDSDIAYLHHTSGTSSGVPKPIPQTHRAGAGVLPRFKDGRAKATFTTTPLYHGGVADCFRAWTSGALIWLFPGRGLPITAGNVVKCLDVAAECRRKDQTPPVKYFSSVPYVLQSLEADDNGLRYLQMMDIVGVGGAALPDEVGDRLVRNGVNLISRFGSAECGFIMSSHRDYEKDKAWQYLRSDVGSEKLQFEKQDDGEGLAELVILTGWPHMAKTNRDDGSFASADLFAPHSEIKDAWRYHSRADSQLTLITGKKFDPAPLEGSIATADLLDDVIIFGNGQPFPGALLFRSETAQGMSDKELTDEIWNMVEKLNADSQDHARIPRKMLIAMTALATPLEKSSKGTLIRGAAEKRFSKEIDNAYIQMGNISSGDSYVPDAKVLGAVKDIVQSVVTSKGALDDDADLYAFGVDSVAGMQIRYGLRQLLSRNENDQSNDNDGGETAEKKQNQTQKQLPLNIVEDCGTVRRLADWAVKARHSNSKDSQNVSVDGDDDAAEHKLMLDMVERYSKFVSRDVASQEAKSQPAGSNFARDLESDKDVVVLTGATGALGAHVLSLYSQSESVSRIYCLVRGADEHAAKERVNKALEQRGLASIDESKVVIVRASLGDTRLGLADDLYNKISSEATIVLHVAWSVNFRMKLRSFEKDNIAGEYFMHIVLSLDLHIKWSRQVPSLGCAEARQPGQSRLCPTRRGTSLSGIDDFAWGMDLCIRDSSVWDAR